ncbi:hypothetical protein [Actinoplanes philippinensis]|uniref:hypothetical protein n=1 Tax=Actinoplanes philippinensis TaxID=35752 RepID=UPI0033F9B90B
MLVFDRDSFDPLGVALPASVASGVTQDGLAIAGALDLTRIPADQLVISGATVKKLGDQAKAVPFTAVVDEATGTVTKLKISVLCAKACHFTSEKFGTAKMPAAPKAPSAVYAWLSY